MKNKITSIVAFIFISTISFGQQIGDGFATEITDFFTPLKTGVYNGINANAATPDNSYWGWQHLFALRHTNPNNNFQLQLASSFTNNDRLFFRKIENNSNSNWLELATRGDNNFIGNQSISGNLVIGTSEMGFQTKIYVKESGTSNSIWRGRIVSSGDQNAVVMGEYGGKAWIGAHNSQLNAWSDLIIQGGGGGNVGIGTNIPVYKLDVIGTIRSREVKVDLLGADFVFENDYQLMPLHELEKYIKENKHLPEIAPAKEMQENGVNLGDLNTKLIQKIEELTLYTIEQNKRIDTQLMKLEIQDKEIELLKKQNEIFKTFTERISILEKQLK